MIFHENYTQDGVKNDSVNLCKGKSLFQFNMNSAIEKITLSDFSQIKHNSIESIILSM
jgi:hypothetical protein